VLRCCGSRSRRSLPTLQVIFADIDIDIDIDFPGQHFVPSLLLNISDLYFILFYYIAANYTIICSNHIRFSRLVYRSLRAVLGKALHSCFPLYFGRQCAVVSEVAAPRTRT
jgi:hypothetical protein